MDKETRYWLRNSALIHLRHIPDTFVTRYRKNYPSLNLSTITSLVCVCGGGGGGGVCVCDTITNIAFVSYHYIIGH